MRTPKFDWTALRPLLENLKYGQKKSLTEIAAYLHENYGKTVTAARLSQIFSGWKGEEVRVTYKIPGSIDTPEMQAALDRTMEKV